MTHANPAARKGAVLLAIAILASAGAARADKKVTICHLPPGNQANPQTISVSETAVGAHTSHGDRLGECPTGCQLNASVCDDENPCTADSCNQSGTCEHQAVNCDDGNVCTIDICSETAGCVGQPNDGAACDDGNDCTDRDACGSGRCRGTAIAGCCTTDADCDDSDACTADHCVNARCTNTQRDCSVTDKCLAGFCDSQRGCNTAPVDCDDRNVCTDDFCNSTSGCYSLPTANPPQTSESVCDDGVDNDCDGHGDGSDADCASQCDCADCQYVEYGDACSAADFPCSSGTERFDNACGCGCRPAQGEICGPTRCRTVDVCCNPSCGICTPPGGFCYEGFCGSGL